VELASAPGCHVPSFRRDAISVLSSRHLSRTIILFAVIAIGLFTARPLFKSQLLHSTDSLTHLYTLVQLDHLVQNGVLYSRWFPNKASGFGTPLFHYHAPLAFYAAQMFRLGGMPLVSAFQLAFGLALVGAALGMYLWTRDAFGAAPALVAAVAYLCGPYMLYNVFYRGGFSEQFALMFMPFVLWAVRRLAVTGRMRYLALAAICYAAMILSHNLSTLIFSPVLLGYSLVLARDAARGHVRFRSILKAPFLPLAAVGLGLGLSAFFWVPALVERDAVIGELLYRGAEFDYRQQFMILGTVFLPPLAVTVRPALNAFTAGLAVIGLFVIWRRPADALEVGFAAVAVVGCVLMSLSVSGWVWNLTPLFRIFQFPHRFLGVGVVFLSFLAAAGVYVLQQIFSHRRLASRHRSAARYGSIAALVLMVGILIGPSRALAGVRYYPPVSDLDVSFVMRKDREAGHLFATYVVNFIPRAVQELPPYEWLARDGPDRLDMDSLPAGAALIASDYRPLRYDLTLSTATAFVATFNTFYFPGWAAGIDGQRVPIAPADRYGRIGVTVPAGDHRLVVWFGSTPIRVIATVVSIAALLGLGAAALAVRSTRRTRSDTS
jgi:hypothetical protein